MRRKLVFVLIAAAMIFAGGLPVSALSLQGQPLESAVNTDFFTFFHLKERARDEGDQLVTHYFRPQSRNDLVVCVDADKSGKILQMSLIVGREFVDDAHTKVFARDIVKSFIEVATPPDDASETAPLVNEIFFRGTQLTPTKVENVKYNGVDEKMGGDRSLIKVGTGEVKKGDVAIMMSGKVPQLPEKTSDGFRVFEGEVDNYDLPIKGAHVVMKNHDTPKGKFLEVRVDVNSVKKTPKFEVIGDDEPSAKPKESK